MARFHCPLYDPQIDRRFDANKGMALGEPPNFLKQPSGAKYAAAAASAAALEKLRLEALTRIQSKGKRG
jgi:hypothetical protein